MEEDPQALLNMKLANPDRELSATQSITLLSHCAELGEENAAHANGKEVVMVMGNTGAGKSTFLNYLMGARMKLVDPEDLGLLGEREVVIVDPEGPRAEIMPIGHGETSQTFMPQIAPDPDNTTRVYCDCPGFADNRGAEINIANALSINRILQHSGGVKAVFLINYHDFFASRSNNVQAMETMCHQMFGGVHNLERHQNAVLLGITQAPLSYSYQNQLLPFTRDRVRKLMTRSNTPTRHLLANRMFLYDPLDRGRENSDFWSRERCRTEIAQLSSIPNNETTAMFQTVLIDSDRIRLLEMARQLRSRLANALTQGDEASLKHSWLLLQRLRVIRHDEVEKIIQKEVLPTLNSEVLKLTGSFKEYANAHNFDLAENQLALLTRLQNALPGAPLELDLNALRGCLEGCRRDQGKQEAMKEAISRLNAEVEAAQRRAGATQLEISELNAKIAAGQQRAEATQQEISRLHAEVAAAQQRAERAESKDFFSAVGTLAGGAVGFLVGGPAGAVIGGAAAGAAMKK